MLLKIIENYFFWKICEIEKNLKTNFSLKRFKKFHLKKFFSHDQYQRNLFEVFADLKRENNFLFLNQKKNFNFCESLREKKSFGKKFLIIFRKLKKNNCLKMMSLNQFTLEYNERQFKGF